MFSRNLSKSDRLGKTQTNPKANNGSSVESNRCEGPSTEGTKDKSEAIGDDRDNDADPGHLQT